MRLVILGTAAALVVVAATPLSAQAGTAIPLAPPGGAAARADINGDGVADMVVTTGARFTYPGDTSLLPNDLGGSVYVIPGGAGTLPSAPPALYNQNNPAVGTGMEADDKFGSALVTGDFNGDGLADVAIGNLAESIGTKKEAGTVSVLYGQKTAPYLRLVPGALDKITQDTPDVPGGVEAGDQFGTSLAAGDFNSDGYADLAVGAPGESVGTKTKAGSVWVLYGSFSGLSATGSVAFHQDSGNLAGSAEAGDQFGWSLAAGDVTGDGRDDLAVVSAGEAVAGVGNAWGSVHLIPGAAGGLNLTASSYASVGNAATEGRWRSVVIGHFHGGAFADVVVAADRRRGAPDFSGALVAIRGSAAGLVATNTQVIDQSSPAIPGGNEISDHFGGSLSVGDLDGDAYSDLAVGVIKEDNDAGAVMLLRGGTAGLLSAPGTAINENTSGVNADAQPSEGFGYGLRILDVTGDGKAELLVTAPRENFLLQTGTLFVVDVGLVGDSFTVTGSRQLTNSDFGSLSNYGPAVPFAGGTASMNDNLDPA